MARGQVPSFSHKGSTVSVAWLGENGLTPRTPRADRGTLLQTTRPSRAERARGPILADDARAPAEPAPPVRGGRHRGHGLDRRARAHRAPGRPRPVVAPAYR